MSPSETPVSTKLEKALACVDNAIEHIDPNDRTKPTKAFADISKALRELPLAWLPESVDFYRREMEKDIPPPTNPDGDWDAPYWAAAMSVQIALQQALRRVGVSTEPTVVLPYNSLLHAPAQQPGIIWSYGSMHREQCHAILSASRERRPSLEDYCREYMSSENGGIVMERGGHVSAFLTRAHWQLNNSDLLLDIVAHPDAPRDEEEVLRQYISIVNGRSMRMAVPTNDMATRNLLSRNQFSEIQLIRNFFGPANDSQDAIGLERKAAPKEVVTIS